ncbi:MAG TPA: thioredoxin family protein [Longimicrobiales bacterium]|nr:thioredoxin family protein [Longimicrobiales bacterium]
MTASLIFLAFPGVLCTGEPANAGGGTVDEPTTPPLVAEARTDSLADVYRSGLTWDAFYDAADARRGLWERNWAGAVVPAGLAERARAAGGPWRILVITEFGCSDSVNSVPYVARLVREVPTLELRLVNSAAGRPWIEAHRSPDSRPATPTILVLDDEYRIRGCWVEQPAALQAFWLDVVARGAASREIGRKMAWYEEDAGRETLRELVEILERAHRGEQICPGSNQR